ncbi:MAG: DUF962 domain-containing protein [Phycisphaerae bacterium]|nr:DUF962 domain-containing protein [Phycisphaerae bacterium]
MTNDADTRSPTTGHGPQPVRPSAHRGRPRAWPAWLKRWLERHQTPVSFWLHVVGIPMAVAALVLAVVQLWQGRWDLWWRPGVLLLVGYVLQWIGHRVEGNDMGEVILIKKRLGKPYVAVSPRCSEEDDQAGAA